MTMLWLAQHLVRATRSVSGKAKKPSTFNPKPPGSMLAGSATDRLLRCMATAPDAWWSYHELAERVSGGSFGWSLLALQRRGHIEASANDSRNPKYLRYRITPAGQEAAAERLCSRSQCS